MVMPKRSRKKPSDANSLAKSILDELMSEKPTESKNPAAVALGRLGGLKGGNARRDALTPEQRKDSAKKAADARWRKPKK
jgi:hypothetical protein